MCFNKFSLKKETIKSIRHMNRVLHTNFSYVLPMEESDFLTNIEDKDGATNELRLEHLKNVLGLWKKGLVEDFKANNKTNRNFEQIKPLFETFLANYIYELAEYRIIDDYDTSFNYAIDQDKYKINYSEYDYNFKNEKIDDIKSMIQVLNSLKRMLTTKEIDVKHDEYLSKYMKFRYYGPMTIIYGYKKIKKKSEAYQLGCRVNPFNNLLKSGFLFKYRRIVRKRNLEKRLDKEFYIGYVIDIEKKRLKIERSRIEASDNRYDFYFDYFMWRLENDADYLFLKQLGGIRKICDLIRIRDKLNKVLEKEAIVVDVDRITIVNKNGSSGSGGLKKSNALDIKSFDNMEKEIRFRKEQKEIRREAIERDRRR